MIPTLSMTGPREGGTKRCMRPRRNCASEAWLSRRETQPFEAKVTRVNVGVLSRS